MYRLPDTMAFSSSSPSEPTTAASQMVSWPSRKAFGRAPDVLKSLNSIMRKERTSRGGHTL